MGCKCRSCTSYTKAGNGHFVNVKSESYKTVNTTLLKLHKIKNESGNAMKKEAGHTAKMSRTHSEPGGLPLISPLS